MKSRTKINISLLALIGIIILLVVGVMQRQANPGKAQVDETEVVARRRLVFAVSDLLDYAAVAPPGPFLAEFIPADLDERTGASWYFDKDEECWGVLQAGVKTSSDKPTLTPFREPNQPEPLLVQIEFESGQRLTLKFVQDSLVDCKQP